MIPEQKEVVARQRTEETLGGLIAARTRRAREFLGVDRAIFYTVLSRGWSAIAGPLTLLCVARFLSAEEQGFFYTFSSILALQLFFELGLAYVIMQIVSHEAAHLHWTPAGTLEGNARAKARLASILRFSLRWYAVVAVAAVVVLALAGLAFFRSYEPAGSAVSWRLPWLLLITMTGVTLLLTPIYGVLEGCGKIADIARLNVQQAVAGSVLVWSTMAAGWQLFAAPGVAFCSAAIGIVWIWRNYRGFVRDLLSTPAQAGEQIDWRGEVLPFQWKIALSWMSGYFIFHLANPVLFRYHGAVEAGRMGMTMRIIDSINALAFAWVATKSAPFGMLIAHKNFAALDSLFKKAAVQSLCVVALGCAAFIAAYHALAAADVPLIARLLPPLPIYFLAGSALISSIVFSQSVYLRAHKAEPFLIVSLVTAVMTPAIMYYLGRPYGAAGIAIGIFASGLVVGLPLATWTFFKKRREWHQISDV